MKRADIKAGTTYFVDRSQDWVQWSYGEYQKVEVLDTGIWDLFRGFGYRDPWDHTLPDGSMVTLPGSFVQRKPSRGAMPVLGRRANGDLLLVKPNQVKATWDEAVAAIDDRRAKKEASRKITEANKKADTARWQAQADEFEHWFQFAPKRMDTYAGAGFFLTEEQMANVLRMTSDYYNDE